MGHIRKGSIKDKIAIIGVGATKFGEHWDKDPYDLLMESTNEAYKDAGIKDPQKEIDAVWCGIQYYFTGLSGGTAADATKLYGKPITRVENYCASGMDAFRNACFGVASGKEDIVIACGVEKLMDEGSAGLPGFPETPGAGCAGTASRPLPAGPVPGASPAGRVGLSDPGDPSSRGRLYRGPAGSGAGSRHHQSSLVHGRGVLPVVEPRRALWSR